MMTFFLVLFAVLALIDVPDLIREREWKMLTFYSILYVGTVTLTILRMLNVDVPNPLIGLYTITSEWLGLSYQGY